MRSHDYCLASLEQDLELFVRALECLQALQALQKEERKRVKALWQTLGRQFRFPRASGEHVAINRDRLRKIARVHNMVAGGYESLRTAKAAFDEGLLDEEDVRLVRTAFLRAQQIKAGLDAGFIREADYEAVKSAFLNSLNMASDPTSLKGANQTHLLIFVAINHFTLDH